MKRMTLYTILLFLLFASISFSAPIGSGFSYQGELLDNGAPANGSYDIQFLAFTVATGGIADAVEPTFLATQVTNGLFSINSVDFTNALFTGEEYWIEVNVRQAGASTYTPLSPRQRLSAVPYAVQSEYLAAQGANNGDVLQFNGTDWAPSVVSGNISPWTTNQPHINYTSGKVSIGTTTAKASLTLDVAQGSGSPFVAAIDSTTVVYVAPNGGTSLGDGTLPPENGLYVAGNTKQSLNSNGMLKYMLHVSCGDIWAGVFPSFIFKSYIGVNTTGGLSISDVDDGNGLGKCLIEFPTPIVDRFWVVSTVLGIDSTGVNSGCSVTSASPNVLACQRFVSTTNARASGGMMILVY